MVHNVGKHDEFFMNLVETGKLLVSKKGIVYNTNTKRNIGSLNGDGYYVIGWKDNGKARGIAIHRLVYLVYGKTKIEKGAVINHKNGIKIDNRISNLEVCTVKENCRHAVCTGLHTFKPMSKVNKVNLHEKLKGENGPNAKLSNDDARKIRKLHTTGKHTFEGLSKKFGVAENTIRDVVNHKSFVGI